jgi:heme-degrading monooxygenase HmoA
MSSIAKTPPPPYYAVIFTSERTPENEREYALMAARMDALAAEQPGYLGVDSARENIGITVSYWSDHDSIVAWKRNLDHLEAQRRGREVWYATYRVRVAKVEREYGPLL